MSQQKQQSGNDESSLLEILIVEDSPDHSELIRRAFVKSAMNVATKFCTSLSEARQLLKISMPDLVLADMRLPDGHGKELLEVSGQAMPLVLMTSFGDETQAVGAIKAGALDYVAKTEESFQELPAICWRAARDWRVQIEGMEAQRALAVSEARYRTLFENVPAGIFQCDTAGKLTAVNPSLQELLGYPDEATMLGLNLFDQLLGAGERPTDDANAPGELNKINNLEVKLKRYGGGQCVAVMSIQPVRENQRVCCYEGFFFDLTKQREADASLRESRQRVSALVENATSGILEVDHDSRIISANPAAVGMLGHNDSSELIGSSYLKNVPRDERKNLKRALELTWQGHDSSLVYSVTGAMQNRTIAGSFIAIRSSEGVIVRVMVMCDDITERHANIRNLEVERNFTAAVISSLPGVFFVFSEDGELVRFNDKLLSAIGYSVEEAGGMTPLDFIASEDKLLAAEKMRELFTRGEAAVEATMVTRDGRRIPYSFNGRMLEQNDKRFMVGFGLDVSERRRNEERFRAQKRFTDTVINSMPGVFYVVNSERRLVRWNNNLLTILGKEAEDMTSLNPMDIVAESDREKVAEGLRQVFEEGASRVEANFVTATGEERPFLLTGVRLITKDATYMVGMGFDISERRRYEAQLRASENYLRSVVESEPECVWTLDRRGCLMDINPAGRMLLGDATVEAARTGSITRFVRSEQRVAFMQLNESVFSGHSGILIFEIETEGGRWRWLETHAVALRDEKGNIEGQLAVTRDITEQRIADKKIRNYSDRLQKLSQRLLDTQEIEKRHLARELHDEVGQSLTALKLNLEAGGGDKIHPGINLSDSLLIIDRVLEQVRDLSLNLRPAILDDLGLLPALRWYIDRLGKRGNLVAKLSADSLTGVRLQSDVETAAFRIVQEALTNVLRHASARRVEISVEVGDDRLSLEVRDDGEGFDAWRQLQRAARGGSFGLMGIKERAALLGGYARVDSGPGKGATVSAWLPLAAQELNTRVAS